MNKPKNQDEKHNGKIDFQMKEWGEGPAGFPRTRSSPRCETTAFKEYSAAPPRKEADYRVNVAFCFSINVFH